MSAASIIHIRPRFELKVNCSTIELFERFKTEIENKKNPIVGHIIQNHIVLDIPKKDKHFWSPQLNCRIEKQEFDLDKSIIKGLIGPKPNVWTMFVFIYFLIGVFGFISSTYGIAQWMVGNTSVWLYSIPFSILLLLSAYASSKYGEYLGREQVEKLKSFIRGIIAK